MTVARIAPYHVNQIIDTVFRAYGYAPGGDLGSNLYLALLLQAPLRYGADNYAFSFNTEDEVTYTGYARQSVARNTTAFLGTHGGTGVSTGTSGTVRIAADKYFPICTTSSQIVTHVAMCYDNVRNAEDNGVVCYWELPRPMQLSNTSPGYYPCVPSALLTIRLDD